MRIWFNNDTDNSTLIKMFNLIDVGERAGSGIPNIFSVWKKQGWSAPVINESFEPDRITLSLGIGKSGDKNRRTQTSDYFLSYLTENVSAKSTEIAELLGSKPTRAKEILAEMVDEDIFVPEGSNKNRVYKLKS